MRNGKRPTRKQKVRLGQAGLSPDNWLVIRQKPNVKHAATHQFGDTRTIRPKKAKALRFRVNGQWVTKKKVTVTIPARPYLGLDEEDMEELQDQVERFVSREV